MCCVQKTWFRSRDSHGLEVRGWKRVCKCNRRNLGHQTKHQTKQTSKECFKREKGCYIIIKGSIQEENITIANIYVPNIGGHRYIGQILMNIKGEINNKI